MNNGEYYEKTPFQVSTILDFEQCELFLHCYERDGDQLVTVETLQNITDKIGFDDIFDTYNHKVFRIYKTKYDNIITVPVSIFRKGIGCEIEYYVDGECIGTYYYEDH